MQLSWLSEQNSWVIVTILLVVMIVSAEIANRLGLRFQNRSIEASKGHFGAVQGSLLGLLALLLSFTFGMSTQRYEARRQLMLEDSNLLHTVYLKATLLPAPQQAEFKQMVRQYINFRADAAERGPSLPMKGLIELIATSDALHAQMWSKASAMAAQTPPVKGADEVLRSLIDTALSESRRINAFLNRIPDAVIWMLLGAATVGMAVISYSAGLGNHRGIPARITLAILVCGTIYIILDLDRPLHGLMRVDQTPIIRLNQMVNADHAPQ